MIATDYGAECAYIPHFYNGFYVFQYATSISAANCWAEQVLTGGKPAMDRYLGVLRAGGWDYGYDILKKTGLDMASPAPYQAMVGTFGKLLDQAEALLA